MSFLNDLVFQEMFAAVPEAKELVPVAERNKSKQQRWPPAKQPRQDRPSKQQQIQQRQSQPSNKTEDRTIPGQPQQQRQQQKRPAKAAAAQGLSGRKRSAPESSSSSPSSFVTSSGLSGDDGDEDEGVSLHTDDDDSELQVVCTKSSQKRPKISFDVALASMAVVPLPPKPVLSASGRPVLTDQTFESVGAEGSLLNPFLIRQLTQFMGFARATEVQTQAIPACLRGKDVLIRSETGSGKTLAYLIPLVQQLQAIRPKVDRAQGTLALVLLPTRELCIQVQEVLQKLTIPFHWLVSGVCMGGEKKKAEKERLRRGCPILVASPGRLLDHLRNTASLKMDGLRMIVFDEADR